MKNGLPKTLLRFIEATGVRALNQLAEHLPAAPPEGATEGAALAALRNLGEHWNGMNDADKEEFVGFLTQGVAEVITATALLPIGVEVGTQAVKAARKVFKKKAKGLKKAAKKAHKGEKAGKAEKKTKADKPKKDKKDKKA